MDALTPVSLLSMLKERDIRVTLGPDQRLHLDGPVGSLTPKLRDQVSSKKQRLVEHLLQQRLDHTSSEYPLVGSRGDPQRTCPSGSSAEGYGAYTRSVRSEDLLGEDVDGDACPCCHRNQWWFKAENRRVCGICHPPPNGNERDRVEERPAEIDERR